MGWSEVQYDILFHSMSTFADTFLQHGIQDRSSQPSLWVPLDLLCSYYGVSALSGAGSVENNILPREICSHLRPAHATLPFQES